MRISMQWNEYATTCESFTYGEVEDYTVVIGAAPTCNDGIQNGDEEGVDCGGSNCAPCSTGCTTTIIDSENFESGWGIWNDGGSDCTRSSSSAYANSGTRSVRLRDNTSSSVATTDNLNLSNADEITIEFSYITVSMDNSNEDFWFQISTNGGSSYTTVEEWNLNDEFQNNVRENESITIQGTFSSNTRLRFRCDASGNADWVYIDDIVISACLNTSLPAGIDAPEPDSEIYNEEVLTIDEISNLKLYPVPARDYLQLNFDNSTGSNSELYVYDMFGQLHQKRALQGIKGKNALQLDTNALSDGVYFILLIQDGKKFTKRFIVTK